MKLENKSCLVSIMYMVPKLRKFVYEVSFLRLRSDLIYLYWIATDSPVSGTCRPGKRCPIVRCRQNSVQQVVPRSGPKPQTVWRRRESVEKPSDSAVRRNLATLCNESAIQSGSLYSQRRSILKPKIIQISWKSQMFSRRLFTAARDSQRSITYQRYWVICLDTRSPTTKAIR